MSTPETPVDVSTDAGEREQSVTPLELFFDLVFVFAFTQVTSFLAHHLTWAGLAQGAALFGVLWWSWVCYSWLTGTVNAEEVMPARLVVLTAMAAMLIVALTVPDAFGDDAILFGLAYVVVRLLHIVLYTVVAPPETQTAVRRIAPGFLGGPALLVVAGFFDGAIQASLWVLAIGIDYGIVFVRGVEGFHVQVEHFVERHRLIMIIALGESLIAIGIGAEEIPRTPTIIGAALLGITLVIALWWLYFDYIVLAAENRLSKETGTDRTVLARDSYSYIHLLIVGSIIFVALGIEQTITHVGEPLGLIPAIAFCGGCGLYLFGHNAFRYRDHRTVSVLRLVVGIVAVALIPVATQVTALTALALLTALFVGLAVYETVWSDHRNRLRSSETGPGQ
ncbi:low temperature requirement protein A [Haloferax mediterranei ATCC 33500]|uniref:Low temperature requirement protein A n=1 Tax=Haloferax mediterranei (strain ATCC 33500 / DSM 1411 / JCM 8866 / NBRC 14739 / NCIMB 2177 / R-4) TaxID=523841 RepID=I3R7A7_HALMT|nr:low temperature requirement protein A [Haloferax mediterranei]AFK20117.1 low temperature requirement protein A [Haloferax mediterranei ATCC 33500]AHZ23490.1 low temperature requirement protein A [Haloferax mediterranei ATCC 33500]ELZ99663.1 low temperature requirement protein A [Haloferax mediterranei ATCC 33500]MDX5987133.1 low temperature requirement protein A [Haloferax mediterranei ATCC 33500]QCQ76446.1 low temperature requirement protein A [Haloferax mediterranei ATCC 33500]